MSKIVTIKCKNPNCNNTFNLHQSIIGRKLYCCSKCGSEHHWMITPLFEKKCLNPFCDVIIKRKFKQQIDKIHYCTPVCRRKHKNWIFQESLKDTIKSNCKYCGIEVITYRENCGKLIPRKSCDVCYKELCKKSSINMCNIINNKYKTDKNFRKRRKLLYKEFGKKMKKKHELYGLSPKWIEWYRNSLQMDNSKSKIEDKLYNFIKNKFTKIERWYQVSSIFVDFYIPDKKLIIECQGDYWHMNPIKYNFNDKNKTTKQTALEQWEKDRKRKLFLESQGYSVVEIWETEINNGDYKKLDIYI